MQHWGIPLLVFIPPTLAATWFGEKERARASAIGSFMNMAGVAVGLLMGGLLIPASKDYEGEVKHGLLIPASKDYEGEVKQGLLIPASKDYEGVVKRGVFVTLTSQAVFSTILLIVSIIFVRSTPPSPPTKTQSITRMRKYIKQEFQISVTSIESEVVIENNNIQNDEAENVAEDTSNAIERNQVPQSSVETFMHIHSTGLLKNVKVLIRMLSIHLLVHSYGIYYGAGAAVFNTLNQMCIQYFPSNERLIGIMLFTNVLCGMLGTLLGGILIDKTHRYKFISITTFVACTVSFSVFTVVCKYSGSFALTFVCFCVYGLFSTSFLSVGFEYMAEITYPVKESNLSFIIFISGSACSFVFTYFLGTTIETFGPDIAGYTVAGVYAVGIICVTLVRSELKRIKIDSGENISQEPQYDASGTNI